MEERNFCLNLLIMDIFMDVVVIMDIADQKELNMVIKRMVIKRMVINKVVDEGIDLRANFLMDTLT